MLSKDTALKQIDEIYKVIKNDAQVIIPGKLMVAVGIAIMAIPLIELVLSTYIDPLLLSAGATTAIIFALRTLFYWSIFTGIGKFSSDPRAMHPIVKKAWEVGKFFPIVPVATAAALAATGYSELIAPMTLILVGCLYALFGQFTPTIVSVTACAFIAGGLAGIFLTTLGIPHLWMYLVVYQGLGCVLMGTSLLCKQRFCKSQE